jgi:3-deoxy-D-arabino-heptulosonate 7-phosphate (DAHP) synthase class II
VRSPNEAWMELHRLAASVDELGLTRQERFDHLVAEFLVLPPLVRRELIRELRFLLSELSDLEPLVIQAGNTAEDRPARRTGDVA